MSNTEETIEVLIVSDIHLGSKVSRSKELLSFLKNAKFRKLILNGDIFDDMNFSRLSTADWEFLSFLRELSAPEKGHELIWIAGNHDGAAHILSRLIGFPVHYEHVFLWHGKRCLAIHGHQFDRFLTEYPIIGDVAGWIYMLIQRIDSRQQLISRFLKRKSKAWLRISKLVATGAIRYGKLLKRADYVFCGHTHQEMEMTRYGVKYWNSGCWTDIPSAYIALHKGEVKIHKVG